MWRRVVRDRCDLFPVTAAFVYNGHTKALSSARGEMFITFIYQAVHRDHAGNLLLLTEAWVFRPGLKAGGHHVVDPCQDLHYLQLLAKLVEDVAECLDKPGSASRVPP
ncbi:hypothetical protein INR49_013719 [Caranx melampygus]|nr:hypothetical protein INR49_013719 [Caranx melampygus]